MKRIEDLTFTDDYMFGAVMQNEELCIGVLERLLHIKIDHLVYPELQKEIRAGFEPHGVRLDVYIKDSDKVYDVEIQNNNFTDLGKRMRFYQSMLDADCLLKGESYRELKESYILFICKKDPYSRNLPKYSFVNLCKELLELQLNDNCYKVVYNASAYEAEEDKELKAFLNYVCTNETTDVFTEKLTKQVQQTIREEKFRMEYLKMTPHETDIRDEAKAEGKIETAKALILLGKNSIEDIAFCCSLPLETVNKLAEEIKR